MTDKKKRQRGTRTHGGGSQKNRRGAGHRGGRGAAGRDKHEHHNHPPLGKSGFTRPDKTQREVLTVDVQSLDEDLLLHVANDVAEETDGGYHIDARDVVDGGHDADAVKVLGNGQVRSALTVVADDFSETAREKLGAAGGEAVVSDRGAETDDEEQDEE